ncbi:MAG: chromosome segregation protein SMC [bacterium]
MRLTKIKLAGFKSFVDATTVYLPGNLIGVVGPNGCGKSNIIDAVRWVMGESSAKHLRGAAMSDVIFSGSNARKPVSQASVELVFDNTDGTIKGEYANYSEIAIRRTANRESGSQYFLNGTRCRRRDITDIFLGTGLGARSYAIIEQGMISRIVESKPEEIRTFLEEAAGISKYKERRKETEARIRRTRENMERLADLKDEVGKQLNRLKRQASAAEKYTDLQENGRALMASILAARSLNFKNQSEQISAEVAEAQAALEKCKLIQSKIQQQLQETRDQQSISTDEVGEIQSQVYEVGHQISQLEQETRYREDQLSRIRTDLHQLDSSDNRLQSQLAMDQAQQQSLQIWLEEKEPEMSVLEDELLTAQQGMDESSQILERFSQQERQVQQQHADARREVDMLKVSIDHAEKSSSEIHQRKQSTQAEHEQILTLVARDSAEEARLSFEMLQEQAEQIKESVQQSVQLVQQNKQAVSVKDHELKQLREQKQNLTGQKLSLSALQKDALKGSDGYKTFFNNNVLDAQVKIAEVVSVQKGWESVVESLLKGWLQGVLIDAVPEQLNLDALPAGLVMALNSSSSNSGMQGTLAEKVSAPEAVLAFLENYLVVDDVSSCLTHMQNKSQHIVVTKEGHLAGQGWIRFSGQQEAGDGILLRENRLKELEQQLEELDLKEKQGSDQLQALRLEQQKAEQAHDKQRSSLMQVHQQSAQAEAEHKRVMGETERQQRRLEELSTRMHDLTEKQQQLSESIAEKREHLELGIEKMHHLNELLEQQAEQRQQLNKNLDTARQASQQHRENFHSLKVRFESQKTALVSVSSAIKRALEQQQETRQRQALLNEQLLDIETKNVDNSPKKQLLLDQKQEIDKTMRMAREKLEQLEERLKQQDQARIQQEQQLEQCRNILEQKRLIQRDIEVHQQNLQDQIVQEGYEAKDLPSDIVPEQLTEFEQQHAAILASMRRLEPVNLAAIQEYEEQRNRLNYLNEQYQDLESALEILESAISKIDKETRTLFKDTFDRVNKGVQEIYPRLFGGGHAFLELTSSDTLEAGVEIMARPPGKRVSNIHLLSGGEKALTAVAFVFSIFRLNPAPFCMLDEVDAPLDDANVGRFCELVKEMSETVQFIFVTHNKMTMEIATQLSGVTMREPGCSRLVQVDLDEAAELASM